RDLFRLERAADAAAHDRLRRRSRAGDRALSDAFAIRWQRSSDDVVAAGRRRSQQARTGPGGGRSVRRPGQQAGSVDRPPVVYRRQAVFLLEGARRSECVAPMHLSMTTVRPPAAARAAASSLLMPVCSHSAFAPIFTASSAIGGVSSGLRNTSTISTGTGMSLKDPYDFSPRTSLSRGLTGITR